jgi:hypothetical protein
VTGTDRYGNAISETTAMPSTAAKNLTRNFYTITSAVLSATPSGQVRLGVTGLGSSKVWAFDTSQNPFAAVVAIDNIVGSFTYKAQYTYDDVFDPAWPASLNQNWLDSATMIGKNVVFTENLTAPVRGMRLVITIAGASQALNGKIAQAGPSL